MTIASQIYHTLQYQNLRVFLDNEEIRVGHDISSEIKTAIESASVHVAIFSEGYAESKWCLDELDAILKSKGMIIPVFWDVEPLTLRYIEGGCYKKAFEEYTRKGRVTKEVMENWRNALKKASHLSGFVFKTKEGNHGKILKQIVDSVLEVFKGGSAHVAKAETFLRNEILKQSEVPKNSDQLEVYKEFITEEFALTHEPDEGEPGLSDLFEADEDGPSLSELFEADEDGPDLCELSEDGRAVSEPFES